MTPQLALLFVCAYFLGAIPVGVLVTRSKGIDISKVGSGNIGATNVMRALGKGWALLVFVLDLSKGLAPALVAHLLSPHQEIWFLAGFAAVLGHCASPFLRFKGGKGVATALGMVFGSAPWVALGALLLFILVLSITRYVSLSSIVGAVAVLLLGIFVPGQSRYLIIGYSLLLLFVLYTHRSNIKRLLDGTENKFTFKKTAGAPPPKDDDDGLAPVGSRNSPPGPRSGSNAEEQG